jgi:hypothetical protein
MLNKLAKTHASRYEQQHQHHHQQQHLCIPAGLTTPQHDGVRPTLARAASTSKLQEAAAAGMQTCSRQPIALQHNGVWLMLGHAAIP